MLSKIKILDLFVILFAILFVIFSYCKVYDKKKYKELQVVIKNQKNKYIYKLSVDRKIIIKGYLGDALILIKNSTVDVIKDPSPRQLCVNQTPISKQNDWIICMPNKISIVIEGKDKEEKDIDVLVDG